MNIKFKKISIKAIIYFSRVMLAIILITTIMRIQPTDAISEQNLVWSGGDVYTLSPSSNMVTVGIYTIKAVNFPAPVRGQLTVNDTIAPATPVTLAVGFELYQDIINNSKPIATFTLQPGDEYIPTSQDIRITIDSMPDPESTDWVYESYSPSVNIRIQQTAAPSMAVTISFTDTNGNGINTVNAGDQFLVDVTVQNTGEDIAKGLSYDIAPDPAFQVVQYNNKLQSYIEQLNINDQFSNQIRLTAPIIQGMANYVVNVNISASDSRGIPYTWNNSAPITVNGSLNLLQLNKFVDKTTVYLQEYVHVVLNVYNRGPIPMDNIHINDAIPYNLKLIQNNTETGTKELTYDKGSLGPDQSWDVDYLLKPIMPGVYVLPVFTASFAIQGTTYNLDSNEEGFSVYGPLVQLNKSAMYEGNNVVEVDVAATNVGNGPTTVIIHDDALPDGATLLSGTTNTSMSLDPGEEKTMSYTVSIPDFKGINLTDWPVADALYFLADYKFETTSNEKIIEETPPPTPTPVSTVETPIATAVPTIQETEKIPVATIPIQTPKPTPGFDYSEIIILFLVLIIFNIKKKKKSK